jgi:hypothetical protein
MSFLHPWESMGPLSGGRMKMSVYCQTPEPIDSHRRFGDLESVGLLR